ncbi:tRNA pseudouridine(13) synthase TruD [Thiomicrospira sp. ALE5]|uniref:tRNA pseudouridine(13) synthase TruD n=1 Tax=Thiomicrospira sp. ALE5 TaxID=748650 RepID=UPI0008E222AF|nr:tRNA pseudouridine(13) synthase TruD [Thiomicrospira sp. ALE5]SFR54834.1 tRNA pseudouridine13 synthase [Thiomicrospira sp. ALE5]
MSHIAQLPYAFGGPLGCAQFKQQLADFQVEEILSYPLTGQGEHLWLWVEKAGQNTDWVAQQLAKLANIRLRDIGFAGLKDRHGITRQWFSLYLPGQVDPEWAQWQIEGVRILSSTRHQRKLQTGGLKGNRFIIRLREVTADPVQLDARLQQIATAGVPNYYGPQRFGRNEHNLVMAQRLFAGELTRLRPAQRSLYISAARSFLFNQVLAERVRQANWNQACSGDVFQLEGSTKWFVDDGSADLAQRVLEYDLHPTGPLVGVEPSPATLDALQLETGVLQDYQAWCQGLISLGLKTDRRALRMMVKELCWSWLSVDKQLRHDLNIAFELKAGQYATSLLRELIQSY